MNKVGICIPFGAMATNHLPSTPPYSSRHNHFKKVNEVPEDQFQRIEDFHIRSTSPRVHHKVDRGTTTKDVSNRNDWGTPTEMLRNATGIQF